MSTGDQTGGFRDDDVEQTTRGGTSRRRKRPLGTGDRSGDIRNDDAGQMRRSFDQIFAAPEPAPEGELADFVAIRVADRPFAVRVAELARIEAGGKIVALPGGNLWLLGLANSQGKLMPVYSLELALGFDRTPGEKSWLAICGREEPLGLLFDAMEGYLRVPQTDIFGTEAPGAASHEQLTVRGGGMLRPVVRMAAVVAAIRERVPSHTPVEGA
ncbi:chemotaxis protein CheW [Zavarzinella formosa]|uniref:chemotaxis protein CheW n=1 Tax=Zavarzinella formosa TaxID=360055 RepID=UPI00035D0848|nr:chemotaxis protein CheW [Zavarzinella formosa]